MFTRPQRPISATIQNPANTVEENKLSDEKLV
jgi:hypothetical protein